MEKSQGLLRKMASKESPRWEWPKVIERQDRVIFHYESFKCKTRVHVSSLKSVTRSFALCEEPICIWHVPEATWNCCFCCWFWLVAAHCYFLVSISIPLLVNGPSSCEAFLLKKDGFHIWSEWSRGQQSDEKWDVCHPVSLTSVRFSESGGPCAHKILEIDGNLENSLAVL